MSDNTELTKEEFEVLKSVVCLLDEKKEVFNITQEIIESREKYEKSETSDGLRKIKNINEGER